MLAFAGATMRSSQMTEPSTWAALVPELLISDIAKSLRFWRDVCGFTVLFDRPDEGFAYLDLDGAQIMLDEIGKTRDWVTGRSKVLSVGASISLSGLRQSSRSWFRWRAPGG